MIACQVNGFFDVEIISACDVTIRRRTVAKPMSTTCCAVRIEFPAGAEIHAAGLAASLLAHDCAIYSDRNDGRPMLWMLLSRPAVRTTIYRWIEAAMGNLEVETQVSLHTDWPRYRGRQHFGRLELVGDQLVKRAQSRGRLRGSFPLDVATPVPRTDDFDTSHFASKNRFLAEFGDRLLSIREIVRADEAIAIWDEQRWRIGSSAQGIYEEWITRLEAQARDQLAAARAILKDDAENRGAELVAKQAQELVDYCRRCASSANYRAIRERVIEEPALRISIEDFDADPWTLNTQNGIVDLRSGTIAKHDPDRRCAAITRVPFRTEAKALVLTAIVARTANGDPDYARYIQLRCGSALVGHNPEQIAVFAYGKSGGNGKSTFFSALTRTLGDYATEADPSTFMDRKRGDNRDDLVRLARRRMVVSSEINRDEALDVATFKRITGGDAIVAAAKYERPRTIIPTWKVFVHANCHVHVTQPGSAIWRRVEVMPWEAQFGGDSRIAERLDGEADGILAWLVEGCRAWIANGCKLELPARVTAAVRAYQTEIDPVRAWLRTHAVPGGELSGALAFESYRVWAAGEGYRPLSARTYHDRMAEIVEELARKASLGEALATFDCARDSSGHRRYRGIQLRIAG